MCGFPVPSLARRSRIALFVAAFVACLASAAQGAPLRWRKRTFEDLVHGQRSSRVELAGLPSNAPEVEVHAESSAASLTLIIRNAGGVTNRKHTQGSGFGLVGMQERATRMGGTLAAQALAKGGFEVTLHIPAAHLQKHG